MTPSSTYMSQSPSGQPGVSNIREVFNYIRRFKQKTFILKIEDSLIHHPLFPMLMKDIIQLHDIGIRIVIIPGLRTTIEKKLKQAGMAPRFVNGVRITPVDMLPLIKLAAMEVTEIIISHLAAGGANGIMGNWIQARSLGVIDGVDYEATGYIEKIRSDIVNQLLDQNFIPVIYNIGFNTTGKSYNVNSNQIACQLCNDLDVIKFFFIGEDDGIRAETLAHIPAGIETHSNGTLSDLDLEQVTHILSHNREQLLQQDRDYLEHALQITTGKSGVNRVHIICGSREGSLLQEVFSSGGGGTMIYRNLYANIRQATLDDVPDILHLTNIYVKKGNLVMRSEEEVARQIGDYYIYEVDRAVYGCGALYDQGDGCGEIGAIAVNPSYKSRGVGQGIMNYLIATGRSRGFQRLFLLTTRTADWFYEFGFVRGTAEDLPRKRQARYNNERNSRVLILDISEQA